MRACVNRGQGGTPLQPWSSPTSQSTSSCSDRVTSFSPKIWFMPSIAPVVENAQHAPHAPWFFTSVTAPFSTQSIESGRETFCAVNGTSFLDRDFAASRSKPSHCDWNSELVKSACGLSPSCKRGTLVVRAVH